MNSHPPFKKIAVSIGLLARNEEAHIPHALESLFRQTLFAELARRNLCAEILCVANACTDSTAEVAARIFRREARHHAHREVFLGRSLSIPQPGKINAWNLYVHKYSARQASYLIFMDADIRLGHTGTLWSLIQGLAGNAYAQVSVGDPIKDLALKPNPNWRERLSLATSRLTQGTSGQLTGQLYCIRAEAARRIYLPRDLAACEDGFIKSLVCTDFLRMPSDPARIVRVKGASHLFEAYVKAGDVLRNQKRQIIGQTFVHVLIDRYLPALRADGDTDLGGAMRRLDENDPNWLKRIIQDHVRGARYCWRLFPHLLSFRFRRLAQQRGVKKVLNLPATLAGFGVTLVASWLAFRAFKRGLLQYWPGKPPHSGATPTAPTGLGLNPATS